MSTTVEFTVYNKAGVKICGSKMEFPGEVNESYAKREIARIHRVDSCDVEIKNISQH